MKIYMSADIEGITGTTHWDEATKDKVDYKEFQEQMTDEVCAACEAALNCGATEVFLKDAHDTGRNIIVSRLPEEVNIIRGWSGHPFSMVQELDDTFHAVLLIGYHSRGGSGTSPLAHTMTGKYDYVRINDVFASEFFLHTYAAALVNVPVVFVSGDEGLCQNVKAFNENIQTVAVKSGVGESTISIHPKLAVKKIKAGVETALRQDVARCQVALPDHFKVEIRYKHHPKAYAASFYPGATSVGTHTITFETHNYFEVLRMLMFV